MADLISTETIRPKRRIVSDHFMNVEKIHPLKQKQVFQLINVLKKKENVKKIIIFGSSVTNNCHSGSDLDFYVELSNEVDLKKDIISVGYDLDYWNNYMVDERLLNEIKKNGVLVYEKEDAV